jgi:AcrR family transcriptional regulator
VGILPSYATDGEVTVNTQTARPLRADAKRNRDAILRAARAVFDTDGIFASLDGIASAAGVGNATLYRNFPTRNDLLAAVIEDSIGDLIRESDAIEREMEADDGLREWLFRLAWALRIWQELPTCIATTIADDTSPVQDVSTRLTNRTRDFLHRARDHGAASGTVTAEELFQLITAVSWGIDRFGDDAERARHRVDFATAGVFRAE